MWLTHPYEDEFCFLLLKVVDCYLKYAKLPIAAVYFRAEILVQMPKTPNLEIAQKFSHKSQTFHTLKDDFFYE